MPCQELTSTASCRAAGCFPFVGSTWSRDAEPIGGEGGARNDSCSVREDVLLQCRDTGGGGAVSLSGCDADCNTCTKGTNYLPLSWSPILPGNGCYWECDDGMVTRDFP